MSWRQPWSTELVRGQSRLKNDTLFQKYINETVDLGCPSAVKCTPGRSGVSGSVHQALPQVNILVNNNLQPH